jgi:GTP cyclohydrolase I
MEPTEAARQLFESIWGDRFDFDNNEHFKKTPERFVKMLEQLTTSEMLLSDFTVFESDSDEMVVMGPIHFNSLCAHHIVPFIGTAYVGYIPNGTICGLSKIPRLVKALAKTLTVQEELTQKVTETLNTLLWPEGVAVVMQAEHLCMTIRGVEEHDTITTTSCMMGVFSDHTRLARSEFLSFVRSNA